MLLGTQIVELPSADIATCPPVAGSGLCFTVSHVAPPSCVKLIVVVFSSLRYTAVLGFWNATSKSVGLPFFMKWASSGHWVTSLWAKPVRSPIMEYSWGESSLLGGASILNTAVSSSP